MMRYYRYGGEPIAYEPDWPGWPLPASRGAETRSLGSLGTLGSLGSLGSDAPTKPRLTQPECEAAGGRWVPSPDGTRGGCNRPGVRKTPQERAAYHEQIRASRSPDSKVRPASRTQKTTPTGPAGPMGPAPPADVAMAEPGFFSRTRLLLLLAGAAAVGYVVWKKRRRP